MAASALVVPAALASNLYVAVGLFSLSYAGISFTSANVRALPPEVAPSLGQVGTLAGFQMVGSALAGIVSNLVIGALVTATGDYNAPLFLLGGQGFRTMARFANSEPAQVVRSGTNNLCCVTLGTGRERIGRVSF